MHADDQWKQSGLGDPCITNPVAELLSQPLPAASSGAAQRAGGAKHP